MPRFTLLASAGAIVTLAACATPQSSPYYTHNTTHEGQAVTQNAPAVIYANSTHAPITYHGAANSHAQQANIQTHSQTYTGASSVHQQYDPQPTIFEAAPQAVASTNYVSYETPAPLQDPAPLTYIHDNEMQETGGQNGGYYGAQLGYPPLAVQSPVTQSAAVQSVAAPTAYQASQIQPAAQTLNLPRTNYTEAYTAAPLGNVHIIQEDDTVYSLSRKVCVSIDEIKTLNNLQDTFLIKAGNSLRLPASNC